VVQVQQQKKHHPLQMYLRSLIVSMQRCTPDSLAADPMYDPLYLCNWRFADAAVVVVLLSAAMHCGGTFWCYSPTQRQTISTIDSTHNRSRCCRT